MGMTLLRWATGLALGCLAVTVVLVPFPPTVPRVWEAAPPAPLAEELSGLTRAASAAHLAVRSYRADRALDRWSAAAPKSETTLVRIDASVPPTIAEDARRVAAEQWAALGTPVSGTHAQVFVYLDTTTIPRAADSTARRRVLEPARFADVAFALPGATDNRRCVALVRLRGVSPAHVAALHSQSLIGVCGFFGAFGLPGAEIGRWLAATGYRVARRSDWSVARAPATDASSLYGLSEPAGRCLTGHRDGCSKALRLGVGASAFGRPPENRLAWVLDVAQPPNAAGASTVPSLGDAEGQFLADAVRAVGHERFARFWQASAKPGAAFEGATGVSFEEWTKRWLARTYGAPSARPGVHVGDLVWLASLAPFALLIAVRRRERVLLDPRFVGRHRIA
jgi:hypothetical protein